MRFFIITLLTCSAAMSVMALLYMAVWPILAKRYSEKGLYYVWLVIIIGLLVPFRFKWDSVIVKVNLPGETAAYAIQVGNGTPIVLPVPIESGTPLSMPISAGNEVRSGIAGGITKARTIPWWDIAAMVWLAGMVIFIAYHAFRHFRFIKLAKRWSEDVTDAETLALFSGLKSEMGINNRVDIYVCPCVSSPMLVGIISPRILLPVMDIARDELCFIVKHELVHYRRKDLYYKCLTLGATAMHWFNPVLYLAARAIDRLCETSCDAETVAKMGISVRQRYAETIISVVRYKSKHKIALSTNFNGGTKGVKNRISSIMDMNKKKSGIIIACFALVFTFGTGAIFAANTEQPPKQPDAVFKPSYS